MEIKHIKELMAVMGRTGTHRLKIKKEGFELELEREENGKIIDSMLESNEELALRQENAFQRASMAISKGKELPEAHHIKLSMTADEDVTSLYATSPMVGTFYNTPSPEDPPFVKVGDKIEKNTIVCIVEAMKVMNEVKSGVSGTIAEILIENGHPVEFGTKLFRIV